MFFLDCVQKVLLHRHNNFSNYESFIPILAAQRQRWLHSLKYFLSVFNKCIRQGAQQPSGLRCCFRTKTIRIPGSPHGLGKPLKNVLGLEYHSSRYTVQNIRYHKVRVPRLQARVSNLGYLKLPITYKDYCFSMMFYEAS